MPIMQGDKKVANVYNIVSGAEIDDTSTTDINKTWSAKKINESIPDSEDFVQNLKMWSDGDIETLVLESVSGLVTISSAVTGMPIDNAAWIGSVNATSTHRQISVQPFGNPSLLYSKIYNASSQTWSAWTKIDAASIEGKKVTDLLQNLGTLTSGSLLDYVLTLPASGFIYCNGSVTDTPVAGTYFIVDVHKMGTTYGITATKFNSGEIYTNRYNSTSKTWYGWTQMAAINDSATTSTSETWSAKKINESLVDTFSTRVILSFNRASGSAAKSAQLNSGVGAYLYWSSMAGQSKYSVGMILYVNNGWLVVPLKETDGGTAIAFSIDGNVLTMARNSSNYPTAGGVIALGTSL